MTARPNYEVVFYRETDGRCPMKDFLRELPEKAQAKVFKWIQMLEERGPDLPRPYADILHGKIRELRVRFGSSQYRFLYFFHGRTVVLTHGLVKKTAQMPVNEIERAIRIMNDFLTRFGRGEIAL